MYRLRTHDSIQVFQLSTKILVIFKIFLFTIVYIFIYNFLGLFYTHILDATACIHMRKSIHLRPSPT